MHARVYIFIYIILIYEHQCKLSTNIGEYCVNGINSVLLEHVHLLPPNVVVIVCHMYYYMSIMHANVFISIPISNQVQNGHHLSVIMVILILHC